MLLLLQGLNGEVQGLTAQFVPCRYNMAADVWSFGIFLEELALGRAPYAHMKLESVILTTLHEDAPTLGTQKTKRKFSEVGTLLLCSPVIKDSFPEHFCVFICVRLTGGCSLVQMTGVL